MLGTICSHPQIITHELLHALGLYHEHTRPDRDNFIIINWSNIHSNKHKQFALRSNTQDYAFRSRLKQFDFESIMLYDPKLFSSNGKDTISIRSNVSNLSSLINFQDKKPISTTDIQTVNLLYNCQNKSKHKGWTLFTRLRNENYRVIRQFTKRLHQYEFEVNLYQIKNLCLNFFIRVRILMKRVFCVLLCLLIDSQWNRLSKKVVVSNVGHTHKPCTYLMFATRKLTNPWEFKFKRFIFNFIVNLCKERYFRIVLN